MQSASPYFSRSYALARERVPAPALDSLRLAFHFCPHKCYIITNS